MDSQRGRTFSRGVLPAAFLIPVTRPRRARCLRRDLKRALGVATWDGARWVEKPTADYTRRERELFTETDYSLPVDFHSTRRAFATALARAGVNVQTSQALTGHSDPKVHQRYVDAATIRELPQDARLSNVPQVDRVWARSVPKPRSRPEQKPNDSQVPRVRIELTTRGFSVHCSTN